MLSDEEKKAIERLKDLISKSKVIGDIEINKQVVFKDIETILKLIEKQSKEIEHQKEKRENQKKELAILNAKQIEFNKLVNTVNSYKGQFKRQQKEIEELKKENLEIRDWKYVIDSPIDLDKLKELDLIKIKGKEYVSKDKIKAKIEEYEKMKEATKMDTTYYGEKRRSVIEGVIAEFQSLLEKE